MTVNKEWPEGQTVAVIGHGQSLSIVINGDYFTISAENANFETAKEALRNKDIEVLIAAIKPIKNIERALKGTGFGKVEVTEDEVLYDGLPLHGVIVTRILEFAREGFDYQPLALFLENLKRNPSFTVVTEFYEWLENADTPMPITEDGCFLAYKKVRANYFDIYSGTLEYKPGNVVEMPRADVDDRRHNTCSSGLHFCSIGYLKHFGSGTSGSDIVVLVKINPADVVSFPTDYKTSKGRCAKMEVLSVYEGDYEQKPAWTSGFQDTTAYAVAGEQGFYSREAAREYKRVNGGKLEDRGYSARLRWVVVAEQVAEPENEDDNYPDYYIDSAEDEVDDVNESGGYVDFYSRASARDYIRSHGGTLLDNGWEADQRWQVIPE